MSAPIIFLDIDGPMIPARAYIGRSRRLPPPFDPLAVRMLRTLVREGQAQMVVSSTWRRHRGRNEMEAILRSERLAACLPLHDDWGTPVLDGQNRGRQIAAWLRNHPEVTTYVALDDDPSIRTLPGAVLCCGQDGIGMEQYNRARELLGLKAVMVLI